MTKGNIVVLCDHNIGYQILDYLLCSETDHEILKVYTTQSNSKHWWKPLSSLQKKKYFDLSIYKDNDSLYDDLKTLDIDYILLLSWKHILKENIISLPNKHIINLHYSLLPKHKGCYPVNWAIINGEKETGVSLHIVTKEIDSGGIIQQKKVNIESWYTAYELLCKLDKIALEMFMEVWPLRKDWSVVKLNSEKTSYHSMRDFKKSNEIDLNSKDSFRNFLNFLKGESFRDVFNCYFYDDKTKERIYVSINLKKETELL